MFVHKPVFFNPWHACVHNKKLATSVAGNINPLCYAGGNLIHGTNKMNGERFWEPGEAPIKVNEEDHARLADWVEDNVLQALGELMAECDTDVLVSDDGVMKIQFLSFEMKAQKDGYIDTYNKSFDMEQAIRNSSLFSDNPEHCLDMLDTMIGRLRNR